eukprot:TRINITY_DN39504_c0_g1_i1.p1 TRINITY_DN39504_c0_g1~~TRINITY_DN39504_c0_g1_i1.p1  ORF type:complete len:986 (+),score=191.99 TRINITY_DN39504_c0_g1_i1:169-2958(+)
MAAVVFLLAWVGAQAAVVPPLFPERLWCWAMPQYRHTQFEQAFNIRRHLRCEGHYRAATTCCNMDKVRSVLDYAEAILDFRTNVMGQQREFGDSVGQSLERSSRNAESPCHALISGALRRRVDALTSSLDELPSGFSTMRRVLRQTLCAHCLIPKTLRAKSELRRLQISEAASLEVITGKILELAQSLERADLEDWSEDAEHSGHRSCLPAPHAVALAGISAPPPLRQHRIHDLRYPFARDHADPRTWHVWVDRFALSMTRLPAKLGYQLKVLTSSYEATYQSQLRSVFWAPELMLQQATDDATWRWPNYKLADRSVRTNATNQLALVVHITNSTSNELVEAAWEEAVHLADVAVGLSVLFVEDSVRRPWSTSVRPKHAGVLTARCRERRQEEERTAEEGLEQIGAEKSVQEVGLSAEAGNQKRQFNDIAVVWRRHQATLDHESIAASNLGQLEEAAGGAVVADLRRGPGLQGPSADQRAPDWEGEDEKPGIEGLGLAEAFRSRARQRTRIPADGGTEVRKPLYFESAATLRKRLETLHSYADTPDLLDKAPDAEGSRRTTARPAAFLERYVAMHREAVAAWKESPKRGQAAPRAMVYICNPLSLCGGHGDRTNGILTAFTLAVLTDRAFFIDSDSPLPLGLLLQPRRGQDGQLLVDWRLRSGAVGSSSQAFYLDDRIGLQADLDWLIRDTSPLLLVSVNLRELGAILSNVLLQRRVEEYGLRHMPSLMSRLWNLLFEPTPVLRGRLSEAAEELQLRGPLPWLPSAASLGQGAAAGRLDGLGFIGIHFRAGNESARLWWDPGRHAMASLPDFLACAQTAEEELGLPRSTQWFLSADTAAALEAEPVAELRRQGKVVTLGDDWRLAHVDRSHVNLGLAGFADSYVAYMLLASARAIVLSRSYFGETAAEIGAVPSAFFAEGCVRTDLHSS